MEEKKSAAKRYWTHVAEVLNESPDRKGLPKISLPGKGVTLGDLLKPGTAAKLAELMPAAEQVSIQLTVYEAIIDLIDPMAKKADVQAVANKANAKHKRSKPWHDLLDKILAEPGASQTSAKALWKRVVANPYPEIATIELVKDYGIKWTDPTDGRTRSHTYRSFDETISKRKKLRTKRA